MLEPCLMKYQGHKIMVAMITSFSQDSVTYAWQFADMSDIFIFWSSYLHSSMQDKSNIIACLNTHLLIYFMTSHATHIF